MPGHRTCAAHSDGAVGRHTTTPSEVIEAAWQHSRLRPTVTVAAVDGERHPQAIA